MKRLWYFLKPVCISEGGFLISVVFVSLCLSIDILSGPPDDPFGVFLMLLVIAGYTYIFVHNYRTGQKSLKYGLTRKEYLRNILVVHTNRDPRKLNHHSINSLEAMLDRRKINY